jgi:hypothetical protein
MDSPLISLGASAVAGRRDLGQPAQHARVAGERVTLLVVQPVRQAGQPRHPVGVPGPDDLLALRGQREQDRPAVARVMAACHEAAPLELGDQGRERGLLQLLRGGQVGQPQPPRRDNVCSTDRVEKLNLRTDGSRMKIVLKSSIAVVSSSRSRARSAGDDATISFISKFTVIWCPGAVPARLARGEAQELASQLPEPAKEWLV